MIWRSKPTTNVLSAAIKQMTGINLIIGNKSTGSYTVIIFSTVGLWHFCVSIIANKNFQVCISRATAYALLQEVSWADCNEL